MSVIDKTIRFHHDVCRELDSLDVEPFSNKKGLRDAYAWLCATRYIGPRRRAEILEDLKDCPPKRMYMFWEGKEVYEWEKT